MIESFGTSTIQLDIVQFDRPLYSGRVNRFSARSSMGDLAILPRHTPLMALLLPCVARIHDQPERLPKLIYLAGGFLEVQPTQITVLAEDALWPDEVDIDAARQMKADAEQRMASSYLIQDRERAQLEWMQASSQIELWEQARYNPR